MVKYRRPSRPFKLSVTHPDIEIYIAALDESLNDVIGILPGLGMQEIDSLVSLA